ncbi:hypothetical protein K504DRAFT_378598 [Pleomassaria siparia CBS 279.74]|uniref:SPX domain-containing protein n=1 Tax=Pleomassaria siparia CBS 279.74 TaxID=1314801 RepID=A0A6G1K9V1_9PLEO|nr:hypothetical protein K504DRAFT_378598 [Pleomassaria siparia CBS 279.74]
MKYGDTLRQRSIPEWGHFNIDYDYLKDLIKHQTSPSAGKALSIPGQGNATERAFGDTFFKVLKSQHDRINLFIKSKSGEIERRLEHIARSLNQLRARLPSQTPGSQLSAKTVERYAKIDADLSKAGEEIRSLSRFRVAQRTGFLKILKKYKRWTRDSELGHRFKEDVCESPSSFFQLDLGHLLDQYIDVLGVLRTPFDGLDVSGTSNENAKVSSSASQLSKTLQEDSEVDFDLALSITPLGSRGSKSTYWIHPDHIVEVEVLLLQHMRMYHGPNAKNSSSPNDTPSVTPARRKSSATVDKYLSNEDYVGLIALDDPESFAIRQNASTVGSSEEAPGVLQAKATGNARWSSSGEAVVVVGLDSNQGAHASGPPSIAKLKRKRVESFLEGRQDAYQSTDSDEEYAAVQNWLVSHREVKPIAGVCCKRTRFAGLHNSLSGGMWATLDSEIFMKHSLHKDLKSTDWLSDARVDSFAFPHAVLEVRRENNQSAALIQALDNSHLVERVRGFSLEVHAVWTCCKPMTMSKPFWIPLLDRDIRKLPAPVKRPRRKAASARNSFSLTSPPMTSTSTTASFTDGQTSSYATRTGGDSSATSVPDLEDPPSLRAFRKKSRKPYSDYLPSIQAEAPPERQRYWNEYDDPESEDDGYYIYIDPNDTVKFPGQELIEDWMRKTKTLLGIGSIPEEGSISSPEYGSSDDETADGSRSRMPRSYGAMESQRQTSTHEGYFSSLFRSRRDPHRGVQLRRESERERQTLLGELEIGNHEREMTKLRFYSTCLASALVIDIILSTMTATSRRKERGVVDFAIIFGTICNLLLLIVAVLSMRTRQERLGWMHQGVVLVLGVGVITADVLLLRWVLNP